jgi:hypothetical protein
MWLCTKSLLWQEIHERWAECLPLPLLISMPRENSSLPLFPVWSEPGILDHTQLALDYFNTSPCRNDTSRKPQGTRQVCIDVAPCHLDKKSMNDARNAFPLPLLISMPRENSSLPLFPVRSEPGILDHTRLALDYFNMGPCRNDKKSMSDARNAFCCHS